MNLYDAEINKKYQVVSIDSGHKLRRRLANLGIYKGVILEKKYSIRKGASIITTNGSKYTLGKGITSRILVEEIR